jgi:hypothetical protein
MPWKKHTSRKLILKRLATGRLVKNRGISGDISGQFRQKISTCETTELHGRGFMLIDCVNSVGRAHSGPKESINKLLTEKSHRIMNKRGRTNSLGPANSSAETGR